MTQEDLARAIGLAAVRDSFRKQLEENPENAARQQKLSLDQNELSFLAEEKVKTAIDSLAAELAIKYEGGGKTR